jgi:hypothetical protein
VRDPALAGALAALVALTVGARPTFAADAPKPSAEETRIAAVVEKELAALHASTATELIEGAPARTLVAASSFTLHPGDGRGWVVVIGLAPGPPGNLARPTEMEYLRFLMRLEDDGVTTVTGRPAREDLITAVRVVLADEARAMDAAAAALTAAKVALPAGKSSWREALQRVTYDSRLPRERFVGDPNWSFVFEPWDEARGGWNMVLLDAGLGVEMVNGRRPGG